MKSSLRGRGRNLRVRRKKYTAELTKGRSKGKRTPCYPIVSYSRLNGTVLFFNSKKNKAHVTVSHETLCVSPFPVPTVPRHLGSRRPRTGRRRRHRPTPSIHKSSDRRRPLWLRVPPGRKEVYISTRTITWPWRSRTISLGRETASISVIVGRKGKDKRCMSGWGGGGEGGGG